MQPHAVACTHTNEKDAICAIGGNAEDTDFHGGVVPDYDFYNYYSGRVERKGGDLGGQYIASDGTLVYDLGNGTKFTQVYDPRTQKYKYIYL